jgi:hypothetical protein
LGYLRIRSGEGVHIRTEFTPIRAENRGFSRNDGNREKYNLCVAEDAVARELFSCPKFTANKEKYREFLPYDPTFLG